MERWFGSDPATLVWLVTSCLAIYATALIVVRLAGRRTVSQLSAFDFLVTVAMGTIVASTAVAPDPSYLEGSVALLTFAAAQTVVATARRKFPAIQRFVDFEPVKLVVDGQMQLPSSMTGPQLTEDELRSRLRQKGYVRIEDLELVILEPDGGFSILPRKEVSLS